MSALDFDEIFERLLGHEGGFTNNRADPGNWTSGKVGIGTLKGTKFGIAANTYPDLDIKALTVEQAKAIYKRDFWDRAGCGAYDPAIGFQVFDACVNHGAGNGIRFLQRAVGVVDDGRVGSVTLRAVNSMSATDVLLRFNAERLEFYTKLSTWGTFGKGWARRIVGNLKLAAQDS